MSSVPATNNAPLPPPLGFGAALRFWFKLGCIGFGGPTGQIALMHQELVERRHWISERRFLHALNYCMVLPGPEAQQLATYIGWLLHGTWGGIAAGVLFVLPSLLLIGLLSWIYLVFGTVPAVAGIFYGIKPAVTAIVVHAAWRIGSRVLHNAFLWSLATAAFIAVFAFSLPFPAIVLSAGIMGLLAARYTPAWLQAAKANDRPVVAASPAWLDDDRRPPHVNFHWGRFRRYLLIGLGCWAGGLAGLALAGGWHGVFTQMGWFFTKAALLTFGGAYAVLPYVYQGAVIDHHWLTGAQMIDGLALGETTPGPLIMVVAFVGFVGAWQQQVLGPDQLLLAGMLGATVATFFTFLPSFLFILLGGPLVEATHGDLKFTAPLSAVTAAVVGVILNLALFFAGHVLWPAGLVGPFEWPALLLGVAAFIALFGWRFNVIAVIGGCGLAGLGYFLVLR